MGMWEIGRIRGFSPVEVYDEVNFLKQEVPGVGLCSISRESPPRTVGGRLFENESCRSPFDVHPPSTSLVRRAQHYGEIMAIFLDGNHVPPCIVANARL